jgi:CHAT domain-containing protein/tetratricopeptide (TPR) repeat protein
MQMDRDSPHVSLEQAAALARGEISEPRRGEIAAHLAECEPCRQRVAEYQEFLADSSVDSSIAPATDLDAEWRDLWNRIRRRQMMTWVTRGSAVAAGLLVALGLAYGAYWILSPSPERLLAQAYKEQRGFDLRLAGAGYAPIAPIQRGSGSVFSYPHSLLKAQERLSDELKSRPDDPELLRLRGEAEMLARQAPAAVETLEKARDLSSEQNVQAAQILADLGVAYALRADVERRFGDNTNALEYLSRAIRLQPRPETIFNRALVLERMMLYPEAVEEWKKYLQVDSTSGWAAEARQHLAEMEKKLKTRQDGLHSITKDPAKFLALAAAGKPIDAEAYLRDWAVTEWLPRSDDPARQAVAKLAEMLRRDHGDSWLAEMTATPRSAGFQAGLEKLAAARISNQRLDVAHATAGLMQAREAQRVFRQAGSRPGVMWASFEEVYSLHQLIKSEECYAGAERLEVDLSGAPYAWLRARNLIESGVCAMRIGRLGDAAARLRQAEAASLQAGFGDTTLRATGMYLGDLSWIGLPSENLARAEQTLRVFWSGAYPPLRFLRGVNPLREMAETEGQLYTAYFLARGGAWAAKEDSHPEAEGPAQTRLAAAAQAVRQDDEAREALKEGDWFLSKASADFRLPGGISLANVELNIGQTTAALDRLKGLRSDFGSRPVPAFSEVQYYSALGEALRRTGQARAAVEAFSKSIERGRGEIDSLPSEREQAGLLKTAEGAYRGWAAVELARPEGGTEALRIWRSFRALDAMGHVSPPASSDGAVLTVADLPDEIVGWFSRGDEVTTHRLLVSRESLAPVIARFSRECSNPTGSEMLLQSDARQLYRWIVEPFAAQLHGEGQHLTLELDGILAAIPVQALLASDSHYFGDQFSLLLSSGYANAVRTSLPGRSAKVLVVANPAVMGESSARFPPLPDSVQEAKSVRAAFPSSTALEGRAATIEALQASLSSADMVHFSGHGYSNANNGALLFSPQDPRNADYDLLRSSDLLRQDWSRCQLVVLSACAAAAGETHGAHNPDSLVRALTRAGVSRVVASLWNVDSAATSELMREFYTALARGASPAEALQAGQQSVRRHPGWDHPYYWAGFQLYGTT